MITPKENNKLKKQTEDENQTLFVNHNNNDDDNDTEEIYSDGSGEAFEQTEEVNEDNFDDLKKK